MSQTPFPLIRCLSRVFTAAPGSPHNCFSSGSSAGHLKGFRGSAYFCPLSSWALPTSWSGPPHRGPSMWTSLGKRVCRNVEGFPLTAGPSLDGWWRYNEQIGELPHTIYSFNTNTLGHGFFFSPETLSKGLTHVYSSVSFYKNIYFVCLSLRNSKLVGPPPPLELLMPLTLSFLRALPSSRHSLNDQVIHEFKSFLDFPMGAIRKERHVPEIRQLGFNPSRISYFFVSFTTCKTG